jgi:hypothetical protein
MSLPGLPIFALDTNLKNIRILRLRENCNSPPVDLSPQVLNLQHVSYAYVRRVRIINAEVTHYADWCVECHQTFMVCPKAPVYTQQMPGQGCRPHPQTPPPCTAHLRLPRTLRPQHLLLILPKPRGGLSIEMLVPSHCHECFSQCTKEHYRIHRRDQCSIFQVPLHHHHRSVYNGSRHYVRNGPPRRRCDGARPWSRLHLYGLRRRSGNVPIWL